MNELFKKTPPSNWLVDLNKHRRIEKPPYTYPEYIEGAWYSENGEDGVLDYLFDYIKSTSNWAVDLGAGCGLEGSNLRHLVGKHNWSSTELDILRYQNTFETVKQEKIFPHNVCELLKKYSTPSNVDLLSMDLDSMDWWVLKEVLEGGFSFNVIMLEYNPIFSMDEPYIRKLDLDYKNDKTSKYGASLQAFNLLLSKYGYSLIHNFGGPSFEVKSNNAIFVKNNLVEGFNYEVQHEPWVEQYKRNNPSENTQELKDLFLEEFFIHIDDIKF